MKYEKIIVGLIIPLISLCLCNFSEAGMYNKEGKPFTHIVVAPGAPPTVKLAAKELRQYLKEVCKADLVITDTITADGLPIFVGQSNELAKYNLSARDLEQDEYRVVCDGKMLAIFGKDDSGQPFAGEMLSRHRSRELDGGRACASGGILRRA